MGRYLLLLLAATAAAQDSLIDPTRLEWLSSGYLRAEIQVARSWLPGISGQTIDASKPWSQRPVTMAITIDPVTGTAAPQAISTLTAELAALRAEVAALRFSARPSASTHCAMLTITPSNRIMASDCQGLTAEVELGPAASWYSNQCTLVFWRRAGRIEWGGPCQTKPLRPGPIAYVPPAGSQYLGIIYLTYRCPPDSPCSLEARAFAAATPTDVWPAYPDHYRLTEEVR